MAKGPDLAGTPAVVSTAHEEDGVVIPAETPVEIVVEDAVEATAEVRAIPEKWTIRFAPTVDTRLERSTKSAAASSGTVDTSVAKTKIRAVESRPLLYGFFVCLFGVGFFTWKVYPIGIALSAIASGVLFAAWKIANLPDWFWMVGAGCVVLAVGIFFGFERKEKNIKEAKIKEVLNDQNDI